MLGTGHPAGIHGIKSTKSNQFPAIFLNINKVKLIRINLVQFCPILVDLIRSENPLAHIPPHTLTSVYMQSSNLAQAFFIV